MQLRHLAFSRHTAPMARTPLPVAAPRLMACSTFPHGCA